MIRYFVRNPKDEQHGTSHDERALAELDMVGAAGGFMADKVMGLDGNVMAKMVDAAQRSGWRIEVKDVFS